MSNIRNVNEWFQAAKNSCFGLILPIGWLGRPYDNQHIITEFKITTDEIYLKFDDIRELHIRLPNKVAIEKDSSGRTNLILSEFEEAQLIWTPYSEEGKAPEIRIFTEGQVSLVGYYF